MLVNTKSLLLKRVLLFVILFSANLAWSQSQSNEESLINQTMLHPVDTFTAYTFQKNEWTFNFPLTPGWFMWGVTNYFTVEIDAECWIGGVPSINGRLKIMNQKGLFPAMAFESMYQHLPFTINLLEGYDNLNIRRKGDSWFNRINMSWKLTPQTYFHLSSGATYSEQLQIDNGHRSDFQSVSYRNLFRPDLSIGLGWRARDWLSLHTTYSEGVTFAYVDNVSTKTQYTIGVRFAPFLNNSRTYLRNLRAELAAISFSFSDVEETVTGAIGYIYWQWTAK